METLINQCANFAGRSLLGGAASSSAGNLTETCVCIPPHVLGTPGQYTAAMACSWMAFSVSICILVFYAYHSYKATCGWEEIYVCLVELIKVVLEIFFETYSPATITQINGVYTTWLRYAEWLLTCPVILIHLSNITGLQNDYNKRTMGLLVSDIGTIVMGITAAFSTGPIKIVFFLLGCCYAINTFFHAAKIYIESYHEVPEGECRTLVKAMAYVFFLSWFSFPILFMMGPEGFGHISPWGSIIGHTFADLLSKTLWGLLGHHLRVKIHEHILIHGDIRKKTNINVAGQEVEVDTFVFDENEDGAVRRSTAPLGRRGSFVNMRESLKARGFDVRASLDGSSAYQASLAAAGATADPFSGNMLMFEPSGTAGPGVLAVVQTKPSNAAPGLKGAGGSVGAGWGSPTAAGKQQLASSEPVKVVLGVLDAQQVEYFKEQFASVPVRVEVVPALGADAVLSVVAQAFGGADCCLLHPEYLRDKSAAGLVARLKAAGQRVCVYGWAPVGAMRELIESSDIDGWVEGPSWGGAINTQQLMALLLQMQAQRMRGTAGAFGATGGGLTRSFSNVSRGMAGSPTPGMTPAAAATNPMFSPSTAAAGTGAAPGSPRASAAVAAARAASPARIMTNQAGAGGSRPGSSAGGAAAGGSAAAAAASAPRGSASLSETELLQQLMGEIARLRNELGEGN